MTAQLTYNQISIINTIDRIEIKNFIYSKLPSKNYKKIFIKPNFVIHQEYPEFPINALVTSTLLIDIIIECCLEKYNQVERIYVGDVPLQSCDWEKLIKQNGLEQIISKYDSYHRPRIKFFDLRRERYQVVNGYLKLIDNQSGDPCGYSEILLNNESFLEEISQNSRNFRVSDYDPKETISVHQKGLHKYLICNSILESDFFINVPKMKTHQKAGITGALKNLVGINGSKAYLVHHQKGIVSKGGDEFPDSVDKIFLYQTRFKEFLQKKSSLIFKVFKYGWEIIKKLKRIQTKGTKENLCKKFYLGSGSWYGNDSIWRMIYDLNMIIFKANILSRKIESDFQRDYIAILDAIIAGEGNGPLQPLPVRMDYIAISNNPFLIDLFIAKTMGFDYKKIKTLSNYKRFPIKELISFDVKNFIVEMDGIKYISGIDAIPIFKKFIPPPGWKGHIEIK